MLTLAPPLRVHLAAEPVRFHQGHAKGRDNYLFAGSPRGADAAAIYYTLVGTCLLQGIDPKRYLVDIAGRLDEPASRLTPQAVREAWEAARAPVPTSER